MLTVGIDIGTSFSSIAFLDEKTGEAEPVQVQGGYGDKYSMPSAAFIQENGSVLLGQAALNARMRDPASFKAEFKRNLGQEEPYALGGYQLLPEELYKEVFIYFKKCAEESTGEKIGKAYITYPANYNKRKKELIGTAARKAGLLDVALIDEPSAAAFCYFSKGKIMEGDRLLIYDFGGGTFDTALLQYADGAFKPLTEAMGIERCGGIDIDNLIFEDILSHIPEQQLREATANAIYKKRFYAQLMDACIRAKHQLSSADTVSECIPVGFDTCDYNLDRNRFNGMIHSLVEETMDRVRSIMGQAGIKAGDIAHVVAVGGTSRIPYVRERLQQLMGKETSKDIDADLAICRGAALMQRVKERSSPEEQFKQGMAHYDNKEYEQAFECFSKAAEGGHAGAQYHLGMLYEDGDGVEQDDEQAAAWYQKAAAQYRVAAESGDADAQYHMGELFKSGDGVEQDNGQTAAWYRKSAEQGNADAQYALGDAYAYGYVGMEKDKKQAVYWYIKAAEQGHAEAQNELGFRYLHGIGVEEDADRSVYWHMKAAEQGNADSQMMIGVAYEIGEGGVTQDYMQSVYWYQKAAEQGDTEAKLHLALLYLEGNGVTQDYKKALDLLEKAAGEGNLGAMYQLGEQYYNGQGVNQDYKQAFEWYKKAADEGNEEAQFKMGVAYENGEGVGQDFKQAVYWYKKAADQGEPTAQHNLGGLYYFGKGLTKNNKQAAYWYQKSAEQGFARAQSNLGILYQRGEGVQQDYSKALYWFQKAADQEMPEAQFSLGGMYDEGSGVEQDYKQAAYWYQKAAEQGDADAQNNLGLLYFNGLGMNRDYDMAGILWSKAAAQGDEDAKQNLKMLRKDYSGRYVKV